MMPPRCGVILAALTLRLVVPPSVGLAVRLGVGLDSAISVPFSVCLAYRLGGEVEDTSMLFGFHQPNIWLKTLFQGSWQASNQPLIN